MCSLLTFDVSAAQSAAPQQQHIADDLLLGGDVDVSELLRCDDTGSPFSWERDSSSGGVFGGDPNSTDQIPFSLSLAPCAQDPFMRGNNLHLMPSPDFSGSPLFSPNPEAEDASSISPALPDIQLHHLHPKPTRRRLHYYHCFELGCEGKQFASLGNFNRHQKEKHGLSRRYDCKRCGKSFTRSTARKDGGDQASIYG
ncbi:uncharacterized protein DSM5745_09340 [Aspergillus mulundensis]|uniref:C2H2-type domain-containing protein n=1 Tax=Aspergillus mulundensis TaxID=1810919 RepID=A0A3D8R0W5_9EURO|nr:hypothetical protein DSM5745_09340 [Aspergillus mulundensis]RDW67474.1 hypothetical protein DSM5745_09340 [Aspergillus mulundensis]